MGDHVPVDGVLLFQLADLSLVGHMLVFQVVDPVLHLARLGSPLFGVVMS